MKENNTTNLNQSASWVGGPAAPTNTTTSVDSWVWDATVTGENVVGRGNNIGTNIIQILNPGGPVTINGGPNATALTLSMASGGSIDMSAATQDLTIDHGFLRLVSTGATLACNIAAGRTLTINARTNVRNDAGGATVNFTGAGRVIFNGEFNPTNVVISSGIVQFDRPVGNTRIGGPTTTVDGGVMLANNTSGSATGTGPVTVSGGALGGAGIITGGVVVNTGAALAPGNLGQGTLSVGSLTLEAGSLLNWEFTNAVTYDSLNVTDPGGLTINGATLKLHNTGATTAYVGNGTYNLIGYSGAIGGAGLGGLVIDAGSQLPGKTYTLGTAAGFVTLNIVAGGAASRFWNTDNAGNWTTAGNWTAATVPNGVGASASLGGGGVTITAPRTVTLDAPRTVGTLAFNSAQSFTLSGSSLLTLDDGGAAASVTNAGGSHTVNVPVALTNGGALITVANAADTLSMNGIVSGGSNGIAKAGPGTLILSADNPFTGLTTVGAGVLQLGTGGLTGSVGGPITNNGVLKLTRSDSALTVSSGIAGTGTFEKAGSGTVTLDGPHTYSGSTVISAGALAVAHAQALQNSTLNYANAGGTITFGGAIDTVTLGGLSGNRNLSLINASSAPLILRVGNNGATTTYSGALSGDGASLTKIGTGTLSLTGTNTWTGGTSVTGGILSIDAPGSLTGAAVALPSSTGARLDINGGTLTATASSNLGTGSSGLLVTSGTANFEAGLTTELGSSTGGNLIRVTGGTLNALSISLGRTSLNIGAEPANGNTANGLYVEGGLVKITETLAMSTASAANSSVNARIDGGSVVVGGAITVGINNTGRWSILDVNGGTLTSTDTTTGLVLGGPLAGQSAFLVRNGTAVVERIQFGQDPNLGAALINLSGGSLYVGSGGLVPGSTDPGFISTIKLGAGTLGATADWSTSLPVTLTADSTIKAADQAEVAHRITMEGTISGEGGINKTGAGTLILSSASNSYTGATTVAAGVLRASGQMGNLTVMAPGTLAPGASIGTLATGSAVIGGTLAMEYDAAAPQPADRLEVTGDVILNPGSVLTFTGTGTLTDSAYVLLKYTGTLTGTFTTINGLPAGFTLNYAWNDGASPSIAIVNSSQSPYDVWATARGLTGASASKAADPDGDGLRNVLEFVLDDLPSSSATSGKFRVAVASVGGQDALTLTLPVPTGAVFSGAGAQTAGVLGVTITIQGSDDLTDWSTMSISEVIPANLSGLPALNPGWTYRTFRTPGAVSADSVDFLRVKVTSP